MIAFFTPYLVVFVTLSGCDGSNWDGDADDHAVVVEDRLDGQLKQESNKKSKNRQMLQ